MRLFLCMLILCAPAWAQSPLLGGASSARSLGGRQVCSAAITANCIPAVDANGAIVGDDKIVRKDAAGNIAISTTSPEAAFYGPNNAPTPPVPIIAASAVAIVDGGGGRDACWMSADRTTLYSCNGLNLYRSVDDGANWSVIKLFTTSVAGVRELDNGELLVSVAADGGGTPGALWLSSGYPQAGANATWTKVLDAGAGGVGPSSKFDGSWGMSCYKNICIVSEYGLQNPPTDSSRFVYKSTDYGVTWAQIFDVGTNPSAHVHGVAYDPWWQAIWLVNGDGVENRALRVSWDMGATWEVVVSGAAATQYVGIIPLEGAILFTTDGPPNGVHRIRRTKARAATVPEVAYALDSSTSLTYLGGMGFRANGVTMPVLLPFLHTGTGSGLLVGTYDGFTFGTLWTDTVTYTNKGLETMVGPTVSGQYVGSIRDDRQANRSRITIPAAPVLAMDAISAERTTAIDVALRKIPATSGSGQYITALATTTSASTRSDANVYVIPVYIHRKAVLDRISIEVTSGGTAGAVIRLGIYSSNDFGLPGALLLDAGTVDATGTGLLEKTISQPVSPGTYWLAAAPQGAPGTGPTMRVNGGISLGIGHTVGLTVSGGAMVGYAQGSVAGALPATYTIGGITVNAPRVLVRFQ